MNRAAFVSLLAIAACGPCASAAPEGPKLGRPASAEEIAGWDIGIAPGGSGLPAGSGTAKAGAAVYAAKCASCHGDKGQGLSAEELVGGIGTLASETPTMTVGSYWPYAPTLFDYVRRAMPPEAPLSLSNDEVYAVSAYILYLNTIVKADDELNAKTLPQIEMPNRDGFIQIYKVP
jgi:cytochrome c